VSILLAHPRHKTAFEVANDPEYITSLVDGDIARLLGRGNRRKGASGGVTKRWGNHTEKAESKVFTNVAGDSCPRGGVESNRRTGKKGGQKMGARVNHRGSLDYANFETQG